MKLSSSSGEIPWLIPAKFSKSVSLLETHTQQAGAELWLCVFVCFLFYFHFPSVLPSSLGISPS